MDTFVFNNSAYPNKLIMVSIRHSQIELFNLKGGKTNRIFTPHITSASMGVFKLTLQREFQRRTQGAVGSCSNFDGENLQHRNRTE